MAFEKDQTLERKKQLSEELARSRSHLTRTLGYVRYRTAFADRAKESFRDHAKAWIGGGLAVGGLLGWRIFRRPKVTVRQELPGFLSRFSKKVQPEEGDQAARKIWMPLLGFVFTILQPVLTKWIANRMEQAMDDEAARDAAMGNE
jgi:hypothetical protein